MGNDESKHKETGKASRGTPSGREHTGHINCKCLHSTDETVEEARTSGRIHLNSACFWSCCGARWDDFNCTAGGSSSSSSNDEHTGHINCGCGHRKNDTPSDLKRSHRIHLNSACFWSCCGARWDNPKCTAAGGGGGRSRSDNVSTPTPTPTATPGGGGRAHTGYIACHCGHKRKQTWEEARDGDLIHRDGACTWSCCGQNWNARECTGNGAPFDLSAHRHSGHIKCKCAHHKNDTVDSLRQSQRVHLNVSCFWSCCGARWDDPICECDLPDMAGSRRENSDHHHSKPKPRKKRDSDFTENISFDADIGYDFDIDY